MLTLRFRIKIEIETVEGFETSTVLENAQLFRNPTSDAALGFKQQLKNQSPIKRDEIHIDYQQNHAELALLERRVEALTIAKAAGIPRQRMFCLRYRDVLMSRDRNHEVPVNVIPI